jgi:hypothetical protein
MLPSSWKPTEHPGPLVRLGAANDGGYPVSPRSVERTEVLLSMGLNDDWRFEEDFRRRRPNVRILCFDHSVTGRFWAKYTLFALMKMNLGRARKVLGYRRFFRQAGVEHRRLMIGYDGPGSVSLKTILAETDSDAIFLKCDIEGGEYRILDDVVANQHRFTAIAIEFHDLDLQRPRIDRFIRGLDRFAIVRVHANNFGGVDPSGDPLVIEMTLTRSDLIDRADPAAPAVAETPNNPAAPNIELAFEPS